MLFRSARAVCAPERSVIPLQGRSFREQDLPWAFLKILQTIPKSKRPGGGAIPVSAGVYSKDASDAFGPGKPDNATVAASVERRRGPGRGGGRRKNTGPRRRVNSNGTSKASATVSVSGTGKHALVKQFQTPRG